MTSGHLFPLLESDHDSDLFCQVGSLLATGNIPTGGGIVVGDIMRRLVARSMAKQIAKKVEQRTSPFHYALSAKAGSESVAHVLQTLTKGREGNKVIEKLFAYLDDVYIICQPDRIADVESFLNRRGMAAKSNSSCR